MHKMARKKIKMITLILLSGKLWMIIFRIFQILNNKHMIYLGEKKPYLLKSRNRQETLKH